MILKVQLRSGWQSDPPWQLLISLPTNLLLQECGTDMNVSFTAPLGSLRSPLRDNALGSSAVSGVWLEGQFPSWEGWSLGHISTQTSAVLLWE